MSMFLLVSKFLEYILKEVLLLRLEKMNNGMKILEAAISDNKRN